jgi:hypothetical protein
MRDTWTDSEFAVYKILNFGDTDWLNAYNNVT